jgi:hypothetical protein
MRRFTVAALPLVLLLAACGGDRNYHAGVPGSGVASTSTGGAASGASDGDGTVAPPSAPSLSAGTGAGSFGAPRMAPSAPDAPVDEVSDPEVVASAVVAGVVAEMNLPDPKPAEVASGEEPFQQLARDRKFDEFRRMSGRFVQLNLEMRPYAERLAAGVASDTDRKAHTRLEQAADAEFKRLNRYMWGSRWSEEDRAAMGWILFGSLQSR